MARTQSRWLWISLLISLAIIAVVLLLTINQDTLYYLQHLDPYFLVLAVGFRILSLVFWGGKIKYLSRGLLYPLGLLRSFEIVLVNLIPGAVTPGQVGGEPVRIHELTRSDVKVGDASAIVIMERLLDGVVLILFFLLAIVFLGYRIRAISPDLVEVSIISLVFIGGMMLGFLYLVRHPAYLKRFTNQLLTWWRHLRSRISSRSPEDAEEKRESDDLAARINREVDNFSGSISRFSGAGRRGLLEGFLFALLFWSSEFLVASFILLGLGQQPYVLESFLFQLIIALVETIPLTPGSAGIAEISAASLYGLIIPSALIGVFVALWRFMLYYLNIILGLIATVVIFRRRIR